MLAAAAAFGAQPIQRARGSRARRGTGRGSAVHRHDPPFPWANGRWMPREDFPGKKSFGQFKCHGCAKTWGSAHAWKTFRQGCKRCQAESLPCCLWLNDEGDSRETSSSLSDDKGPHEASLCEACVALGGDCRRGQARSRA